MIWENAINSRVLKPDFSHNKWKTCHLHLVDQLSTHFQWWAVCKVKRFSIENVCYLYLTFLLNFKCIINQYNSNNTTRSEIDNQ